MKNIRIYDRSFFRFGNPSCATGSTGKSPKKIKWSEKQTDNNILVFTDTCLYFVNNFNNDYIKIAWLIEPRSILPKLYDNITLLEDKFDYICTYDNKLLQRSDKYIFIPIACGHWIYDDDIKIHNKTKNISIILSPKRKTIGHKLRHKIVDNINLDKYGKEFKNINNKIEGLKDYRFHVVVENDKIDNYYSEKLLDAFITGCIPFYFGTKNNDFNDEGIIYFNDLNDLKDKIDKYANEEYYNKLLKEGIIQDNFNISMDYLYPEDYAYEKLFKKL